MHDITDTESAIREAERLLDEGDPQVARSILAPYVAQRVPAALFLYSSVSAPGESIEAFERRSFEMLSEAAELGHVPANHCFGEVLRYRGSGCTGLPAGSHPVRVGCCLWAPAGEALSRVESVLRVEWHQGRSERGYTAAARGCSRGCARRADSAQMKARRSRSQHEGLCE